MTIHINGFAQDSTSNRADRLQGGANDAKSTIWEADELVLDSAGSVRFARALLTGFELRGSPARIGPLTLRKPDWSVDERLRDYGRAYKGTCVLELRYRERRNVSSVYAEPMQLLQEVFVAMQMVVDAWIGSSVAHHFDDTGKEVGVSGGPRTATADSWHPNGDPLLEVDGSFVQALKQAVSAQSTPLANAIYRFSKGCTNLTNDAILDFVVVLDALLGFGINDEITHRVASRGAYLLEPASDTRLYRYTAIKYLYRCRSKFVHEAAGDVQKPNGKEREAFKALGVTWEDNDAAGFNRYHVADLARRTSRAVLWKFVNDDARLDGEWLTRLELGLS